MMVYYNDKYLSLEKVAVSPFDRGFMFADGVYEAIRTYNGKLFQFKEHIKRLKRSLEEIEIRFNRLEKLEGIIYKLIKKNTLAGEAIIYLQITRGAAITRTHSYPEETVEPTLFISANPFESIKQKQKEGIKVILHPDVRWMRCDIKSVSLLPNILANQKAKECGAAEAILVRDGLITEGARTNFFAINDGIVYTAPVSNYILSGITRNLVIKLAKKLNLDVKEEFIKEEELKIFNEFFITSTTKEITPVVKIDDWIVGGGKTGKVTRQLQKAFKFLINSY